MLIKKKRGFSVTEISICVLIVGLMMALGVAGWTEMVQTARSSRAKAEISVMAGAVSQYRYEIGRYPANLNELMTTKGQYGPWLAEINIDPWGNPYQYAADDTGFVVFSWGKDESPNGSNVNTGIGANDIGYWFKCR